MSELVNKLFGAEDSLFLALIDQKLKKKFWPLRRIFFGLAPCLSSGLTNFESTKCVVLMLSSKDSILSQVPRCNIVIKYQRVCIIIFRVVV